MCGIVAYIGQKNAFPIVINGLKRLEYRGYDSSGISCIESGTIHNHKKKGRVIEMESTCPDNFKTAKVGIGHTRWATHGAPSDLNAHPHLSQDGKLSIVHNGIIENYASIKKELENRGYTFQSETDTEVLCFLIADVLENEDVNLFQAVRLALTQVVGAYAIVAMHQDYPDILVAGRKGSPLVIGIGEEEYYLASDATPIIEFTKDVVYLEEEEIAEISIANGLSIKTLANDQISPFVQKIEMELEAIEKGGYDHFMLKEIFEQPRAVADCLRGRLNSKKGLITIRGLQEHANTFKNAERLIIVACGTSWHSGLVAEYFIESLARVPVEVEYASEFRYRDPIITPKDIVIAISQSGETADTLAALQLAKERGATIYGICNVVGSSIARLTDAGTYTHAGPEIGVASTKAFTSQLAVLSLLGLAIAQEKGTISTTRYHRLLLELDKLPEKIEQVLTKSLQAQDIAQTVKSVSNALFLGRGINFPIALEGALKLKEISYIHAEGYPAAEMKHGPIALIDADMPVFVVANAGESYKKVVSNIQEVKARNGKIIAIVTEGDTEVKAMADYVFEVPATDELLTPMLTVIPLQLIAYYVALLRGCNVDQPRNLAKSVTVE